MSYIYAIITLVIVSLSAYGLHSISINRLEAAHRVELAAKAAQCDADKAITTEVSNAYQKNLAALDARRAHALDSLRECALITVQGGSALRYDAGTSRKIVAGRGAGEPSIPAWKYVNIASKGEKYRIQLKACQSFVLKTTPGGQKPAK